MISPFKDNNSLMIDHIKFNKKVSATRIVVERTFDILKDRF